MDTLEAEGEDYMLAPATRLLWRSPTSIHLELGSHAVIVDGLPAPVIQRVTRRSPGPAGRGTSVDAESAHALRALAEAGYLWRRSPGEAGVPAPTGDDTVGGDASPPPPRDRRLHIPGPALGPEFTTLTAQHGTHAAAILAARRACTVALFGSGRVTPHLGSVLAAAGVGRVHCAAGGTTLLHHAVPGGARPRDEGRLVSATAERAIRAAAPNTNTRVVAADERPDLTVVAVDGPFDEDHRRGLHARNAPYLAVALDVGHGIVGPLVLPGLTSCTRCADLHRRDRDPAWPALAAQLSVPRRYGPASDVATATVICGVAAQQALAFLDGGDPDVLDATIELRAPDWRLRRRSWPLHAECDCAHAVQADH